MDNIRKEIEKQQQAYVDPECTFRPNILKKSISSSSKHSSNYASVGSNSGKSDIDNKNSHNSSSF